MISKEGDCLKIGRSNESRSIHLHFGLAERCAIYERLHSELERFHFISAGQSKGKVDHAQKTCLRRRRWSAKFHVVGRTWMEMQGPVECLPRSRCNSA